MSERKQDKIKCLQQKKCFISGPLNKFSEQMSSEKRSQRAKQGMGGVHKVGDGLQG